jgi:hypothetical protein
MSGNKSVKPDFNAEYDKSDLLKPHKLVVSLGERSILLYDNKTDSEAYNNLFKEAKRVIRTAILTNRKEEVKTLPQEEIAGIRNKRGVSFIFNTPLEIEVVYKLMNISTGVDFGIKRIDEIIVSQRLDKIYLNDTSQNILFELKTEGIQNNLNFIISNLEKQPTVSSLSLDSFHPVLYSKNAVVPTRIDAKGLPVISGKKELTVEDDIPSDIAGLFDDEISSLSIIKNMDGTLIYTDREEQMVKLYTNGMLEYVNYAPPSTAVSTSNFRNAIDISTEFVIGHFGFPENCYISDVIKTMLGERYIIRYRYTYDGLPIVLDSALKSDTIEVEVVNDEVKRYKRLVRTFNDELEYKPVVDFRETLDILFDKKVEILSGEKIKSINDMYLAYYERYNQSGITYIPVWVVEVTVERADKGTVLDQNYIIDAETGIILDK